MKVELLTRKTDKSLTAEILKCKYCGSLTVSIDNMGQCPKGCPGNFSGVGKPVYFEVIEQEQPK